MALHGQTPEFRQLRGSRLERFRAAIAEGLAVPDAELPSRPRGGRPRLTPDQERRVNQLRAERDRVAQTLPLDPTLLASRSTLEGIACGEPVEELLMPWQRELLKL
jgi:ribonuclease D